MKMSELFEGEVVKASFGNKGPATDTGIDVPKGYDRFELDHADGEKSAWIVGIKGSKKTRISRAQLQLAKELVKAYNNDGKSNVHFEPISLTQAFGSRELAALETAGIQLTEKPDSWGSFEDGGYAAKRNIHEVALKKAEKATGVKFKEYSGKEVFGADYKPAGPLARTSFRPESMFIVKFDDGTRYLVDVTGANTYIRNWQKID